MGPSEEQMDKAGKFLIGTGVLAGQLNFAPLSGNSAIDWWPERSCESQGFLSLFQANFDLSFPPK